MQLSLLDWQGVVSSWLLVSVALFALGGLGFAAAGRWRLAAWLSLAITAIVVFQLATRLIPLSGDNVAPAQLRRLWVFYIGVLMSGIIALSLPIIGASWNRGNSHGPTSADGRTE